MNNFCFNLSFRGERWLYSVMDILIKLHHVMFGCHWAGFLPQKLRSHYSMKEALLPLRNQNRRGIVFPGCYPRVTVEQLE